MPIGLRGDRSIYAPLLYILLVPFVALTIFAVGLVGFVSFRNGRQAVNDIALQLQTEITERIQEYLGTYLETPHKITALNAKAINQGLLDYTNAEALMTYFHCQINIFPTVTSIYFGNIKGGLADSGREGANGPRYMILTDGFTRGPLAKYVVNDRGTRTEVKFRVPFFDSTGRPWYINAAKNGDAIWSPVYVLSTGQDMAIAASRPVRNERGELLGVVAVDLFLSHINNFLENIRIGKTGQAFIMERSGLLVASSTGERPYSKSASTESYLRLNVENSGQPILRHSMQAITKQIGEIRKITDKERLVFAIGGKPQILQVTPIRDKHGLDWLAIVVIPEADFLATIHANNYSTFALIVATLFLVLFVSLFVARRIVNPVQTLNKAAESLSKGGKTQVAYEEIRVKELRGLAKSFNLMASDLETNIGQLQKEIRERRRTQETLEASETLFRDLVEKLPFPVVVGTADYKTEYANPSFTQVFGYTAEDIPDQETWQEKFFPDPNYRAEIAEEVASSIRNKSPMVTFFRRYMDKRGSEHDVVVYLLNLGDRFYNIIEDITERKRAEDALQIQRDLGIQLSSISDMEPALNLILETVLRIRELDCGGIYMVNSETGGLDLVAKSGLSAEFIAQTSHYDAESPQASLVMSGEPFYGHSSEMLTAAKQGLSQEGIRATAVIPVSYEDRIVAALNLASHVHEHIPEKARSAIEAVATQIGGVIARMEAEEKLRQSQQLIQSLFDGIDDFMFILDGQGRIIMTNQEVENRLGYSSDELLGMPVTGVHPPDRREEAMAIVKAMLAGEASICPVPLRTKDGDLIAVETKVTQGRWAGQEVLFGISRDITDRLEAERARQSSEDRLLAAIDAIDEGFVIYDSNDRLVMCNAKYREIYNESSDLIVPGASFEEILREGVKRGQYTDAIGWEEEWIAERMAQHKAADSDLEQNLGDGRWIKIAERRTKDGCIVGFRVDISEMKRAEKRIEVALREKETLLREIHHRVKNNMAVISSLLSLQSLRMEDETAQAILAESQQRVRSMALIHETLYQSDKLDEIDLSRYIDRLASNVFGVFSVSFGRINLENEANGISLDIGEAVPCGIILNELITNTLKYAFPDNRSGKIVITVRQDSDNWIELVFSDSGVGLPENLDLNNSSTMGFFLVNLMVEQLHGVKQVNRDQGTEFVIRWPRSEGQSR